MKKKVPMQITLVTYILLSLCTLCTTGGAASDTLFYPRRRRWNDNEYGDNDDDDNDEKVYIGDDNDAPVNCALFEDNSPARKCCAPRIFDLDEDFQIADVDASVLTSDTFMRDFVGPSRPVIIRNGMNNWHKLSAWTNEFIASVDGDRQVSVELAKDNVFRFYRSTFKSMQMSLRAFLGRAFNRTGGPDDTNQYYLAQQPIQEMNIRNYVERPSFTDLLKVDADAKPATGLLWLEVAV